MSNKNISKLSASKRKINGLRLLRSSKTSTRNCTSKKNEDAKIAKVENGGTEDVPKITIEVVSNS